MNVLTAEYFASFLAADGPHLTPFACIWSYNGLFLKVRQLSTQLPVTVYLQIFIQYRLIKREMKQIENNTPFDSARVDFVRLSEAEVCRR